MLLGQYGFTESKGIRQEKKRKYKARLVANEYSQIEGIDYVNPKDVEYGTSCEYVAWKRKHVY